MPADATTSRWLGGVARCTLLAVLAWGLAAWWRQDLPPWGAITASLLLVLIVWLMAQIAGGRRTVPGNPFFLAIVGPCVMLAVHWANVGFEFIGEQHPLAGALDASLLFQLVLMAMGVMLTQDLLSGPAARAAAAWLCGAGLLAAGVAALGAKAIAWPVYPAFLAGLCAWQAGACMFRRNTVVLVISAVLWGVLLSLVVIPVMVGLGIGVMTAHTAGSACDAGAETPLTLFGLGERAFAYVGPSDSGWSVLVGVCGVLGSAWLLLGAGSGAVAMAVQGRRALKGASPPRSGLVRGGGLAWLFATIFVTAAWLSPGGMFVPSCTLAMATAWGLLPAMLGRPTRDRRGIVVTGIVLGVLFVLGMASSPGLASWVGGLMSLGQIRQDSMLHFIAGAFVALMLLWQLAQGRWWRTPAALLLAVEIGALAEVTQGQFTRRAAEWSDWLSHCVGCAAAIVPFALCRLARRAERAEAIRESA